MHLPSHHVPNRAEDFIGPAREACRLMEQLLAATIPTGSPLKLLFHGAPGIGKSSLMQHAVSILGADKWTTHKLNGTQCKVDVLDGLAFEFRQTNLFGGYRVLWIEEVDTVPSVAQIRLLTILDDLPRETAVICTTNKKPDDLEERYQTRFHVIDLQPPTADQIHALLKQWPIDDQAARHIAEFACGNVRQALLDADIPSLQFQQQKQAA